MAPWSSLTGSRHSLRAPWSSLLLPLLFLLLLAPHTSRPQDIEDFKCWNAFFSPDSEATNQSHGKRGTTTTYIHSPKACGNQTCVSTATIIYPYNLKNDLKGDIKNEIGSQHEIFCRFNSSIFNAQDIYFEIKNRSKDFDERLPHKIVNDSTIMAMLPSDYSFDGQIRCKKEEQDQYLCFRDLRIGYEPQDVENFTCISDNWETLNCTWDVPNNPLKVDYTLTYVVPRFMNRYAYYCC